jgi:pre-mRNA-processing factor 17
MNRQGTGAVPTGYANDVVISETTFRALQHARPAQQTAGQKRKRETKDVLDGKGSKVYKSPWAKYEASIPSESESEYEEVTDNGTEDEAEAQEEADKPLQPMATDYIPDNVGERTEFLGSEEHDYLGRSYMHVPADLDINLAADLSDDYRSYVPKKVIHTWKQQKGSAVTALRFFPNSGHLLLGASGSGKVMLYDVYRNKREAVRSYMGHNKLCNDICFTPDGLEFLSSSLDRKVKLWDTETGQCKTALDMKATPHVVRINPSLPHEFLAGLGNNKIMQYDLRSGEVVQEYDYHLGPVNTITFCDENRRFVSTSDDRKLSPFTYSTYVSSY